MNGKLDHKKYYRLPWTLSDNSVAWLEPTKKCNLYCEGCYSDASGKHKSLDQVKDEVLTFIKLRNFDSMSIAGGDPLTHPDIIEIVRFVAEQGLKPILNTNGLALTEELLHELKDAGLIGVTIHIDSKQTRPGWKGKTEIELSELRLYYAKMIDRVGGIQCGFNSTVYGDTLKYVPELVRWAGEHIDVVNLIVFIAYRAAILEKDYDYYANGKKIDTLKLPYSYSDSETLNTNISSYELYHTIKKEFPDFEAGAYLGGTVDSTSTKWLLTSRIGNKKQIFGYTGPKFVKLIQLLHHIVWGKYLAYPKRWVNKLGRIILLTGFPIDKGVRKANWNFLKSLLSSPLNLFRKIHLQSIMFIQPIDMMPDGQQNMCDGCPDVTLWKGQLVWSCRLEEPLKFGCFVQTLPKRDLVKEPA
ncbi:MAG: hypothetical protein IEMM0008_1212 [bacterium]|nr:MAG: hypothetical protein IEMM0008_1212 [bacterium]